MVFSLKHFKLFWRLDQTFLLLYVSLNGRFVEWLPPHFNMDCLLSMGIGNSISLSISAYVERKTNFHQMRCDGMQYAQLSIHNIHLVSRLYCTPICRISQCYLKALRCCFMHLTAVTTSSKFRVDSDLKTLMPTRCHSTDANSAFLFKYGLRFSYVYHCPTFPHLPLLAVEQTIVHIYFLIFIINRFSEFPSVHFSSIVTASS
jgi:hypothetical protein